MLFRSCPRHCWRNSNTHCVSHNVMTTTKPLRAPDLPAMKSRGEKIVMLTAYDATMARLLDQAGADVLLVGDSLGMVILGGDDTLAVTMEDMIHHTRAVRRGARRAFVIADMPFMSYQASVEDAVRNEIGRASCRERV